MFLDVVVVIEAGLVVDVDADFVDSAVSLLVLLLLLLSLLLRFARLRSSQQSRVLFRASRLRAVVIVIAVRPYLFSVVDLIQ